MTSHDRVLRKVRRWLEGSRGPLALDADEIALVIAAAVRSEGYREILSETLDRLVAFVDRDAHDQDDLAILDATLERARNALGMER